MEKEAQKLIRLNKYLAHAGIANRRQCDDLIKQGLVKVNNTVVTETGVKININDTVQYRDEIVSPEKKVYILLNKPKKISSLKGNKKNLKSIYDLVKSFTLKLNLEYTPNLNSVDIIDDNDLGLIVLTNDNDLITNLSNSNRKIRQIFQLQLDKELVFRDLNLIKKGIKINNNTITIDNISYIDQDDKTLVGIQISRIDSNILKEIFGQFNYSIIKQDRTAFLSLTKRDLPRGRWRLLEKKEIIRLKHFM